MKKLIIASVLIVLSTSIIARPNCPIQHHPISHPVPYHCPPPMQHHSHHNSWIGPTVLGSAILGSAIINAVTQPKTVVQLTPTVVTQPVVVQQPVVTTTVVQQPVKVWVEGCYVDQVQANGIILKVWQPGHWEWR